MPACPGIPCAPGSPLSPLGPGGPVGPLGPWAPGGQYSWVALQKPWTTLYYNLQIIMYYITLEIYK